MPAWAVFLRGIVLAKFEIFPNVIPAKAGIHVWCGQYALAVGCFVLYAAKT